MEGKRQEEDNDRQLVNEFFKHMCLETIQTSATTYQMKIFLTFYLF